MVIKSTRVQQASEQTSHPATQDGQSFFNRSTTITACTSIQRHLRLRPEHAMNPGLAACGLKVQSVRLFDPSIFDQAKDSQRLFEHPAKNDPHPTSQMKVQPPGQLDPEQPQPSLNRLKVDTPD